MKRLCYFFFFWLTALAGSAQMNSAATHIEGLPCEEARAVVVDDDGFVWVGTRLGLVRYDGYEAVHFHNDLQHPRTFSSCDIRCMCLGRNNDLWLGTFDGVCRFDIRSRRVRNYRFPSANYIAAICCKTDGSILAKTSDGTFRYDEKQDGFVATQQKMPETAIPTALQSPFPGQHITASTTDRRGNTWLTIDNRGLWCLRRPDIVVHPVATDITGRFMPLIAQFSIRHIEALERISNWQGLNALLELPDGTLIGCTEHGGLVSTGTSPDFPTPAGGAATEGISLYGLAQLDSTHLLAGMQDAICLIDNKGQTTRIDRIGGQPLKGLVLSINVITPSDIWLGMVGGAAHITGNILKPERCRARIYNKVGNYPIGGIFTIKKDARGTTWLCSSEPSLMCYDTKGDSLQSVSLKYDIRGDNVHDMAVTPDGSLWLTTNYGLLCLRFDNKGGLLRQNLYTRRDGLPENYLGSSNLCVMQDGRLCLIGQLGACIITPQRYGASAPQATAERDGHSASDGPQEKGGTATAEARVWLTDTLYAGRTEMTFPHDIGELTFHLSRLQYGDEHSQRYRYQLLGWDSSPHTTPMGSNVVTYTGLQPGSYVFEYEGGRIAINIQQPLWWRWWARLAYLLVILAAVGFVAYILWRQHRQRERLRRMRLEHDLYTHVTHQLMAPLDIIIDTAEGLKGQLPLTAGTSVVTLEAQTDRLKTIIGDTMRVRSEAMNSSATSLEARTAEVKKRVSRMTDVDKDFLRRCRESVTRHLAEPDFSHRVMMDEVGASHSTLYRKLKALTGMDTATFVRQVRINAACQLLNRNPKLRISELSAMVGYSNPKYFSTHFKAVTGVTPQQYKRS